MATGFNLRDYVVPLRGGSARKPTPGIIPMQDDSDFWRQWNSQVANQWNAYDQGGEVTPLDFGQASANFAQRQKLAALPFSDQQTYLTNQHRMQQDAIQNRLALMQEGRLQGSEAFDQRMAAQNFNRLNQQSAMTDVRNQLKGVASAFGMDDIYPFLQNYSQERGGAQLPDVTKPTGEVVPGRFISAPPERFNALAGLWSKGNPELPAETLPQRAARQTAEHQERSRLEAELRTRQADASRQSDIDQQTMYARNEQEREARRRAMEQNPLVPFFARPMNAPSMPDFSWMRNMIPPGMAGY